MGILNKKWCDETIMNSDLQDMLEEAGNLRDQGHGRLVSYSRKVFVPLTQLCRDVCHYCTFAKTQKQVTSPYLSADEVLDIAKAGERAGCSEILFTLGDKPELRYESARIALQKYGHSSTIEYLADICQMIIKETNLLPHVNPGVMSREEIALLRKVSVSQGIMLESSSLRLSQKGGVHFGSPDKHPSVRLKTIEHAGELSVPFTSGILIGIGETRKERLDSLYELLKLHKRFGHLQEIIVQNFRAKAGTKSAGSFEPTNDDLLWTIAAARIIFGPHMNIQAPPNLTPSGYSKLLTAGINDWGGISPVTPDHVNPEAPWPLLDDLQRNTEIAGKELIQRLAIYPSYAMKPDHWVDQQLKTKVLRSTDSVGYKRTETWAPGLSSEPIPRLCSTAPMSSISDIVKTSVANVNKGYALDKNVISELFHSRGADFLELCRAADELRHKTSGNIVRYVVTRNINYTNICKFHCNFCAFSKGRHAKSLEEPAYDLKIEEIVRRTIEARERGATEVCLQGGIHPSYTGETYLKIVRAIRAATPDIHIHAFSPLEITYGASTLGISIEEFLTELHAVGLSSLPGTAAEILSDDVRRILCPDKLTTLEWLNVIETAHKVGLTTTSTIMFGHIDTPSHWADHLLHLRSLQERTGGITEFVPLPFIHMEAPIFYRGQSRQGPTYRETVLMHAISRLVLHPVITNIQVSWVKLGPVGAIDCLQAGANDLGGTLMNESISNAAGTEFGQEMSPQKMDSLILSIGRNPVQRNTTYGTPLPELVRASYTASALLPVIKTPASSKTKGQLGLVTHPLKHKSDLSCLGSHGELSKCADK